LAGYLAIAVVAGAPNSPLTVLLPAGAQAPSWAAGLARITGVARIPRQGLIAVSWVVVPTLLAAFVGVLIEAWATRIRLSAVLAASGIALAISVAAPLLLSRDVYTYAGYGRIDALYGQNPYSTTLSAYPHDPFVAAASKQWLPTHSLYGPLFTMASAAIARIWAGSPSATILAFKVLSGAAITAATGFAALAAARARPERAALAAALVGLNPVVVIHTVGGGHVDALIAAPLAAAMAIAVTQPRAISARAIMVTVLLTAACLIKAPMMTALALWMWWVVRTGQAHRGRTFLAHAAVIGAAVAAFSVPFVDGWRTLARFSTLGGIEVWASPSHLVGHAARLVVGSVAGASAGAMAAGIVEAGFLVLFVVLVWQLARRTGPGTPGAPADAWGIALLLLALSMPFLLPWYAAWFAPFLALVADEVVVMAGALVTCVLALTLIPADPFYGYSTRGVMDGVHYGAASVLLAVLVVVAWRVLRGGRIMERGGDTTTAASEERRFGSAIVS